MFPCHLMNLYKTRNVSIARKWPIFHYLRAMLSNLCDKQNFSTNGQEQIQMTLPYNGDISCLYQFESLNSVQIFIRLFSDNFSLH